MKKGGVVIGLYGVSPVSIGWCRYVPIKAVGCQRDLTLVSHLADLPKRRIRKLREEREEARSNLLAGVQSGHPVQIRTWVRVKG